jgi:hypothetical protein
MLLNLLFCFLFLFFEVRRPQSGILHSFNTFLSRVHWVPVANLFGCTLLVSRCPSLTHHVTLRFSGLHPLTTYLFSHLIQFGPVTVKEGEMIVALRIGSICLTRRRPWVYVRLQPLLSSRVGVPLKFCWFNKLSRRLEAVCRRSLIFCITSRFSILCFQFTGIVVRCLLHL